MEVWSPVFLTEDVSTFDASTCAVTTDVWRRITEENEGVQRLIAHVTAGEKDVYVALGSPVQDPDAIGAGAQKLFLPVWLLDQLQLEGMGEQVEVAWLSQEAFPEATRIVLRPHDSAFYHADAKEELERALTRFGVLRQGDTILVPISSLGGYEIAFDVMITEPANLVLAQGDEVVMEFEGALDVPPSPPVAEVAPEPSAPQLQAASLQAASLQEDIWNVLPAPSPALLPAGIPLGGGPTRRMPDGRAWNPYR